MSQDQTNFCYIFIEELPQAIIAFVAVPFLIFFAFKARTQYRSLLNLLGNLNKNIKAVFILIIVWEAGILVFMTVYILKIVFTEIIFWVQYENESTWRAISEYILIFDEFGIFLIQTIPIRICYNWITNLIDIFQLSQNQKWVDKQKFLKKLIAFYSKCRIFFLIFLLILIIAIKTQIQIQIQILFFKITSITWLFQSILIVIMLLIEIYLLKNNKKLKEICEQASINQMINKYWILFGCALLRTFFNLVFSWRILFQENKQKCLIKKQNNVLEALKFFFKVFVCNLLIIFITLRLYDYKQEEEIALIAQKSQTQELDSKIVR